MKMLKLKHYWADNSKAVKKALLWIKGFTAMLAGTAYVQGDIKFSFYVAIAGALLDGILQLLPPGDTAIKVPQVASVFLIACLLFTGCAVIKPGSNTTVVDSTSTTYKPVNLLVKGAKVSAGLNMDSLYHSVLMAREQRQADSLLRLQQQNQWLTDSLAAARANKPPPAKPIYIASKPLIQYVTDPATKARLSYYIDAFGRLNIGCEAKDQTIQTLQATVTRLQKQTTVTQTIAYRVPWYAYTVFGICIAIIAVLFIKQKL